MDSSRWASYHPQSYSRRQENEASGRQSVLFRGPGSIQYYPQPHPISMAVCNFYQRGACKFGDACKYEHPGSQRDNRGFGGRGGGGFGGNNNRYGAFAGDSYRPGQQQSGGRNSNTPRYNLDKSVIKVDLTDDRPLYPLSCYGPGKDAPRQLIEGPVEVSPDELRSRYYMARRTGNEAAAQEEQVQLGNKMDAQIKSILDDLNGAVKYIEDGADIHPNRIDIVAGKVPFGSNASNSNAQAASSFTQQSASPFGGGTQSQAPGFGQTSAPTFGQPGGSAFGQPSNPGQTTSAFGQPSNPGQTTSAFGQPSKPGQTTSAFGQPSNPGQTASPFGQPSALGGGSAFGKPSMPGAGTFGQPAAASAFGGSAFGKPSMPGPSSAFGQTSAPGQQSAFGQPSAPGATSAFGKPSVPGQTPGFGQATALGQGSAFGKPAFGQSAFGQASQPGATSSPFAQQAQGNNSSPFGQAQSNTPQSAFGQQAQTTAQPSPFGQAQPQNSAQPSPFGGATTTSKPAPFGAATPATSSPFATQNAAPATQNVNPFGAKPQSVANTSSPFGSQGQTNQAFGQPQQTQTTSPFGQPAQTNSGTPASAAVNGIEPRDRYKEGRPEEYEGEKGKLLEEVYRRVAQTGFFDDDEDIPLTPPKCEWIVPV